MKRYKNILIIGGGGYVGTKLSLHLASLGYNVTALDTFWFGDFLPLNSGIKKIRADIRNRKIIHEVCIGQDVLILLACLSNDPLAEIDPQLTKAINLDAVKDVIIAAKNSKSVKRLIYASSASVYGIQNIEKVTEDIEVKPITLYSKYKVDIENIVIDKGDDDFTVVCVRSATVCGYSPRMRFDLLVNLFVYLAIKEQVIYLEGGNQIRPLINIHDIVDFYTLMITIESEKINKKMFNVSSGNYKVIEVAELVKKHIPCELKYSKVTDPRSYPVCADKSSENLGFNPRYTFEDAIIELMNKIKDGIVYINDPRSFNLRYLKTLFENKDIYSF